MKSGNAARFFLTNNVRYLISQKCNLSAQPTLISITLAKLESSSGMVALKSSVCLWSPTFLRITFSWSLKPISNRKSASSKISISTLERVSPVSLKCCIRRPGVAMTISGLQANDSNCPSNPCPPMIRDTTRSVCLMNCLSTLLVYRASSLVGDTITQRVPKNKKSHS